MSTQPQVPSSPLGSAATNSLSDAQTRAKAMAEEMGKQAAIALANQVNSGQIPEWMRHTAPGTPAPEVMPQTNVDPNKPTLQSEIGGSYTNYGQRVSHDKTALINEVGSGVKAALAAHKETEVKKAGMDYQILMGAISALQRLDGKDPKNAADIEHNQKIVQAFFADEKKVKRLEKVFGFDAFDPKKEQQKQADPHYQAFQQAATTINKNAPSGVTTDATAQVPATQAQAPTNNEPAWMTNLPEAGKQFMKRFPSMPPDPMAEITLQERMIKGGILPSADKIADNVGKIISGKFDIQKELLNGASAVEVAKFQNESAHYKANMDAASAEKVAAMNLYGTRLKVQIDALGLQQKQGEFDLGNYEKLTTLSKSQADLAKEKQEVLIKNGVTTKEGWFTSTDPNIVAARKEYNDAQAGYNQALTNMTEYMKRKGFDTKGLGENFTPTPGKVSDIIDNAGGKQLVPSGHK